MQGDFIEQVILPVTHDLGGFKVHRTLPAKERTMVGPFLFFDQMGPAQLGGGHGIDVRPHPHINLSTVTYLFDGAIEHRDSLGTDIRIAPGAVNLMTAGHGSSIPIAHRTTSAPPVPRYRVSRPGSRSLTPRHVWWNFVSSRPERIEQAKRDGMAGDFARVPGDAKEWIPIPEIPLTVSYP